MPWTFCDPSAYTVIRAPAPVTARGACFCRPKCLKMGFEISAQICQGAVSSAWFKMPWGVVVVFVHRLVVVVVVRSPCVRDGSWRTAHALLAGVVDFFLV
jgi:hypothetical protein